jgi:hypothetical protein
MSPVLVDASAVEIELGGKWVLSKTYGGFAA